MSLLPNAWAGLDRKFPNDDAAIKKHTPGPWRADPPNLNPKHGLPPKEFWSIRGVDEHGCVSHEIARLTGWQKTDEANANLLGAAPDLYAALQAVLRVADIKTIEYDLARFALAKAKGYA